MVFFPEDSNELAGLLAHLAFCCLPVATNRHSGGDYKKVFKGLQLRVQLRYFTGFPFETPPRKQEARHQIAPKVEKYSATNLCPLCITFTNR